MSMPWSVILTFSAVSIVTPGLCCPTFDFGAADCLCYSHSAGYGGGLASFTPLALPSLSPSSTATRIELISAIVIDVGETTAIVTAQPFGRPSDITDFC
ncbi:hypothetical protein Hdeb2414_s0027g00694651 [Helianthus debilis subsp. tardiflorus]